jgi:hypothetical protein
VNLTALLDEFYLRGVSYLDDGGTGATRATAFINQGRNDLNDLEPWDYLVSTATGTAPLSIPDLRDILYVATANGPLDGRDVSVFLNDDPTLTQTGTASYYWLDGLSSLKLWPADSSTAVTVRYLRVPADLSSGSNEPSEIPSRYHHLIVDFAVIRALRDRSNFAEAQALRASIEPELDRMRDVLLGEIDIFQRSTEASNA